MWILFILVSVVYCGCLELKPFMSVGFFMWPGYFFSSRLCVFEGSARFKINVFHSLHQTFFTLMVRQNKRKQFIFLGDHPYCSLHLSTLLLIQESFVWSCIVILLCLCEVVEGTWLEGAYGAFTNTLHPWWIRSVWFADLASWHQTSIEHAPTRHHRVGKIPQCPAFTLGLLIR